MTKFGILSAAALAVGVAACGGNEASTEQRPAQEAAQGQAGASDAAVHSAEGEVTAVSDREVTIDHGAVESIGWPAMTMGFKAPSPEMLEGIAVGDRVRFQFRQDGGSYVLTSISKA